MEIEKILNKILGKEIDTVEAFELMQSSLEFKTASHLNDFDYEGIGEDIRCINILKLLCKAKEEKKRAYNKAKIDVNILSEFLYEKKFETNKHILTYLLDSIS